MRDLHLFFCILTAKIRGEQRKPTDSPYRSRTDVFPIIFTLFGFIQIHTGRALPPTFKKCPAILQMVPLKEIASYLKITPVHMSRIRRKQSLDNKNKHRFRNLHSEQYSKSILICQRILLFIFVLSLVGPTKKQNKD